MTTLQKQIKHINNNLFAARMENIIQYMYEDELENQVAKVFHRMRKGILKNLKEYYSPDIMVNAHMDLILAPIHEYHKKYYDTIMKYKLREHRKGQVQGRRLVKRAKQYAKAYSKNYFGAVKADSTIPMSSIIQKDKLFATSDYSAEHMRDKTFVASENTLARVDKDINKIITDGYTDGWGINDVASNIEKRFSQLETWEARRIARTEIHGSHMQGIMQSYEEMGVEYTQWASAHDNRTRDTHSALDGEIIPFGGVYSNGLRYPGDTNGPISEWINCRCGNIPWFCPPGMMVPVGMSHFRESDLIPLGYYDKPGVMESLQEHVFDETRFANLKTNEEIADFFGYEYIPKGRYYESIDGKTFEFYDKKNDVYLRFFREGDHKCRAIDFTNSGKGEYDLKEVLRIYDETHPNLKVGVDDINFKRWNKQGHSGDASGHTVNIYDLGLTKNKYDAFESVLDHELGHVFEDTFLLDNEFSNAVNVASKLKPKINKATKLDIDLHNKKGIKAHSISDYATTNDAEEFAELVSQEANLRRGKNHIVCGERFKIKDETRISGFKRRIYEPTLAENKENNPNRFSVISDLLDHPEKINPNWRSETQIRVKNSRKHLNDFIKQEQSIVRAKKVNGYNKYALTETEEKTLAKLEPKKDSLKFKDKIVYQDLADRKEFNEMWNKILLEGGDPTDYFAISGAEGVRYEKLFKKFKNWVPKTEIEIKPIEINKKGLFENKDAFKLTSEEKKNYKQLKENLFTLPENERKYYLELKEKVDLNRFHSKLITEGLDEIDSKNYIKLYQKYAKEWDLPEISPKLKFSTEGFKYSQRFIKENELLNDFKLTTKENNELWTLEKKKLINPDSLTSTQTSRMEFLQSKQEFNMLYSLKIQDGGLNYGDETKFKELFAKLKYKLNLHADLLDNSLPEYVLNIKPEPITNKTKLIKLKGTTENGVLPGNRDIEEYFTIDVSKCTPREKEVLNRWLSNDYAHFRDVIGKCDGDLDKFTDYVLNLDKERLHDYYYFVEGHLKNGDITKAKQEIREIGLSIKHDYPILENILENNQLKQNMTLWRTEERHHLFPLEGGKPAKGKTVIFKGNNSTAVTREGAEHFAEVSHRDFEWMYEIEAPEGTRGAYVSHMFDTNPKFAQEMEFLLAKDTKMEIIKFDEAKHYAKLRIIPDYETKPINSSFTKYITKDGTKSINVREVDDPSEFLGYLIRAEDSVDPKYAWRVELPESISNYDDCRMFVTEHGSTIAIREDGDIISVCAYKENGKSIDSTRALLEFATKNGGDRFDSFDGNYGVYRRCGFEPVSHIEFNEEYAPPGWIKERDNPENVIFFKYTGEEVHNAKKEDFYKKVDPITTDDPYEDAYGIRDKSIKKDLELK
ncbi:phage minor head protein [uncultured Methanobrevibacter sp.]|uniref:phage minor head protein n=1 Tax=uncultured Methanobrevibacter sp. TaxID=253161 RepID=UPI0025CFB237|nr:phage minor head protein [uncultured Methanobrevibacter sp.]